MKLFNTLTKKLEEFAPQDPKNVKVYTCGPTVYSYAHIGNFASYIYWDLLVRTLSMHQWTVNRVMNITDVGHLTSDGDEGDDKLEKGAKRENKTVWEVADFYTKAFFKDFYALNLVQPNKIARATDYIKEDIEVVKKLIEKGYTYETSDGIYFDTSKFARYADFARLDLENLKSGARVEFNPEKRHASDFAIWKFIQEGEDHAMRWDFLGRSGYPGWHLECSTISHTELGEPLDIHTGGIDHIPVHHTNEIAQSETAFEKQMSRFWLHCNFITIDGQKISKSLGNVYNLSDLIARGFAPADYKVWILQGHYQSERNFTFNDLSAAKVRRLKWRNQIAKLLQQTPDLDLDQMTTKTLQTYLNSLLENTKTPRTELEKQILTQVGNNLNSAEVFSIIDQSMPTLSEWAFVEQLFGINLFTDQILPTSKVLELIQSRQTARKNKDYQLSDQLRDQIAETGFTIADGDTPIWQYLK